MKYDETQGSPYDRGAADSYYGRAIRPHKWVFESNRLGDTVTDLTPEEVEAYLAGYNDNEAAQNWKIYD